MGHTSITKMNRNFIPESNGNQIRFEIRLPRRWKTCCMGSSVVRNFQSTKVSPDSICQLRCTSLLQTGGKVLRSPPRTESGIAGNPAWDGRIPQQRAGTKRLCGIAASVRTSCQTKGFLTFPPEGEVVKITGHALLILFCGPGVRRIQEGIVVI